MNQALSSSHEKEWLRLSYLLDAQIGAVLQRKDLASRSFSFFHRAMGEGSLDGEGTGISVTSRVRVRYKQIIIVFWECRQPSARELRRGTFVSPLPRDRWNS